MEFITAKKPLKVKHGKTAELDKDGNPTGEQVDKILEVPSEFKKFATMQEAEVDAGSPENLLAYVNASAKADSATPVRNYKAAEGTADADVITKASGLRKSWSIKDTIKDGLSQKEKAETLDEVTKLLENNASREDILAAIRKTRA